MEIEKARRLVELKPSAEVEGVQGVMNKWIANGVVERYMSKYWFLVLVLVQE